MSNLPESSRKRDKGEQRVPLANVACASLSCLPQANANGKPCGNHGDVQNGRTGTCHAASGRRYHERPRVQAGDQLPGQWQKSRNIVVPQPRMLRVLVTWRSGSCWWSRHVIGCGRSRCCMAGDTSPATRAFPARVPVGCRAPPSTYGTTVIWRVITSRSRLTLVSGIV